jgi:hypothetical protein
MPRPGPASAGQPSPAVAVTRAPVAPWRALSARDLRDVGRSQCEGRGFEPLRLHHSKPPRERGLRRCQGGMRPPDPARSASLLPEMNCGCLQCEGRRFEADGPGGPLPALARRVRRWRALAAHPSLSRNGGRSRVAAAHGRHGALTPRARSCYAGSPMGETSTARGVRTDATAGAAPFNRPYPQRS